MDKPLRDEILVAIASNYPFSIDGIRAVYEALKSFDATIKACDTAVSIGVSSPLYVIKMIEGEYSISPTLSPTDDKIPTQKAD